MRDLLPAAVAVAVAGAADWTAPLLPAELACLSERAVEGRRRDFTAGRVCARRALADLRIAVAPVPAAPDRSPVWPAGVVGSITHTTGFCAAVAARTTDVRSVGIDAERHRVLEPRVREMICGPEELAWCAGRSDGVSWPTVIFSAKETVYKVWYPLVRAWLDFHDAQVELDPAAGTFTARISAAKVAEAARVIDDPPEVISGRFAVDGELIRTAAVLPVSSPLLTRPRSPETHSFTG